VAKNHPEILVQPDEPEIGCGYARWVIRFFRGSYLPPRFIRVICGQKL